MTDLAGTPSARANARPPRVELLEVCWRFVGPSQRTIECGIYEVATGLEVRAGHSAEDIVRTQDAGHRHGAEHRRRVAPKP